MKDRKYWNLYLDGVRERLWPSLRSINLGQLEGNVRRLGFTRLADAEFQTDRLDALIAAAYRTVHLAGERNQLMDELSKEEQQDRQLFSLAMEFWRAVDALDLDRCQCLIESGIALDFQHPVTGMTPLHTAAAHSIRPLLRLLVDSGRCDYLVRDDRGRLAYDLASAVRHRDAAVARLLFRKTWQQASDQGLDPVAVMQEHAPSLREVVSPGTS